MINHNKTVTDEDKPRLTAQCLKILDKFNSQERVSTSELAAIAAQYNARIYDLRHSGYDIKLVERGEGGMNYYQLMEPTNSLDGYLFDPRKGFEDGD